MSDSVKYTNQMCSLTVAEKSSDFKTKTVSERREIVDDEYVW